MWNIFDMMFKWFYAWNKLKQQTSMTVIVHQTDLPCMRLQQIPSWKKTTENSFSRTWGTWNWAGTKRSCDIIFMKMKVIWFSLLGHILNKIIVIWFFKPAPFSQRNSIPLLCMHQTLIFGQKSKRCEESKRTLKNPFSSCLAEFDTTLKLLRITDQWYIVPVEFWFGRNWDFMALLLLPLARGLKVRKCFYPDWRLISSASKSGKYYWTWNNIDLWHEFHIR